jgi:glycosyltransferase involved in cell wall biosynthesis
MNLLWIKTDYLHPTTRGGQIRTLEMLKRLHRRHKVTFVALDDSTQPEGPERACEYSSRHYSVRHRVRDKRSLEFARQLAKGLVSPLPVAVNRYRSPDMRAKIEELDRGEPADAIVCDFLFPAPNVPDLSRAVLFQHNVEAMIWERRAEHARTPLHGWYFAMQARRMAAYEGEACRTAKRVVAVSRRDAREIEQRYGALNVGHAPTGVDADYFAPPAASEAKADLVFLGSMDWAPNIDGATWFLEEAWPLIRRRRPSATVAIVGRNPARPIAERQGRDGVLVTGTVPDVRPWLHGARVSIVPLRIGGGTRLKIFEAMAAGLPVVSTTIGAEGLETPPETTRLADTAEAFAEACCALLDDDAGRRRMGRAGRELVASDYSWDAVTDAFERLLV